MLRKFFAFTLLSILGLALACSSNRNTNARNDNPNAARNDKEAVEKSLDQAGFSGLRVEWDKDKRVIALNGRVRSPELKAKAGDVARQAAAGNVVSNQLSIEPVDDEHAAKTIERNVDDAIEKNFKAVLVANRLDHERIHYKAKNGVLTIDGKVKTPAERTQVQKLAATVPNVDQVVNKLDVDRKNVEQAAEPR
ncbi:MAG: BON domain-containing protein [Terriglobales bacterium]